MRSISVCVPATVTNLGSGFDSLGLAVSLYNRFSVRETSEGFVSLSPPRKRGSNSLDSRFRGNDRSIHKAVSSCDFRVEILGEGEDRLPKNKTNFVYCVMEKIFRRAHRVPKGLILKLENNIPIGKGLGSSASCVVGGLVLANALVKARLSQAELIDLAVEIEGHPDNVLPAFVGGFTIAVSENKKLFFAQHKLHRSIFSVLIIPDGQVLTRRARKVLPSKVPFKDAVFNLSRAALTVSALTQPKLELLQVGMQDRLHESYRKKLFPKISSYLQIARNAGGSGCSVSGSGPTVITFALGMREAHRIAARIRGELRKMRLKGNVLVAPLTREGVKVS